MKGRLVKVCSNGYTVRCGEIDYKVRARGKLKVSGEGLCVGDYVEIEDDVILKVYPRKNQLIRPRVSNVDGVMIVLASQPKPDYYLTDKVIINANKNLLDCVIVVNKLELDGQIIQEIQRQYQGVCKVMGISAKEGRGIQELKAYLQDKTMVLAGQSAVGKTSIVNTLFSLNLRVGDLSEKIQRGKHTTTYSQIFSRENVSLIDSPGFAQVDTDVSDKEISSLYFEYEQISNECKYRGCTHINEPDCMVKKLVESGKLNKERYERYKEIYSDLKKRRKEYE